MKLVVLLSLLFCYSLATNINRDFYFNNTLSEVDGCTSITPIGLMCGGLNQGNEVYYFRPTLINGVTGSALFFNNTGFWVKSALPNGGSSLYVYSYSLVMDVIFDHTNGDNVIPIFNAFPNNDQASAVSLLRNKGVSFDECNFSGNFSLDVWYRISIVADLLNSTLNVTIFNGATGRFLGTTAADPMALSLYSYPVGNVPPLDSLLLFGSTNFPGPSGAIHFLRFYNYSISPATVASLGGPQVAPLSFVSGPCVSATAAPPTPYTDPIVFATNNNAAGQSQTAQSQGQSQGQSQNQAQSQTQSQNPSQTQAGQANAVAVANPFSGSYFSTVLGVSLGITFFVLLAAFLWVGALFLWRRGAKKEPVQPVRLDSQSGASTPQPRSGYDILPVGTDQANPYSSPYPAYANNTQGYGVAINAQ